MGPWYITPDSVDFSYTGSLNVTDITPQNDALAGHNPEYDIGTGGNSTLFEIVSGSDTLALKAEPNSTGVYNANVTAAGSAVFEDGNNHRMMQVTVMVADNTPPTVEAGPDQEVAEGATVTLSGTATDADTGDTLTYSWTHDGPSRITFADPAALSTMFTAPNVAANTTFTVTLTVNDGTVDVSDNLQVNITVSPGLNLAAAGSITDAGALRLDGATGIAVFESGDGTYAAVASNEDDGVQILDVTDPFNVTAAGGITDTPTLKLNSAQDIAVFESGGNTYAAVAGFDEGVQILDVTDPFSVTAADGIDDTTALKLFGARAIAVFESGGGTYAAVAAQRDNGVQILNITDPSAVTAAGSIGNTGTLELDGPYGIATFTSGGGTYAAVASSGDDGVQILDVTDPANVTAAGSIDDSDGTLELDGATGIATFTSGGGTYAAVASQTDNGVQILDITDPSNVTAAGSIGDGGTLELSGAWDIAVFESGGGTYAAVASSGDDGVQILRLTSGVPPAADNTPPAVEAGPNQEEVAEGDTVTLSGTASDSDGDPLTHMWTHDGALTIAITGSDSLSASFTAPNVAENTTIAVTLTVSDGTVDVSDTLQVTITDSPNSQPVVEAGDNQTVNEGATVNLSGTATDADPEDTLTYSWTGPSGITFADPAALSTSFRAPNVAENATITVTVTLTVNDGTVEVSDALQVTITYLPGLDPTADVRLRLTATDSIADTGTRELLKARGIATFESGGRTYAAVTGYLDYGVQILDVTDPSDITAAGSISDDAALELAGAWGIATFTSGGGTYAAVAAYWDDGVQILNITDPSDITATDSIGDAGTLELSGAFGIDTFTSGGRTYAAVAAYWDDGVQILDVTDPPAITAAGSIGDAGALELFGASDVATFTSGGRTYAAVAAYWDDGVQILDVTDPPAITAAGSITDDAALELLGASGIATFTSGGRTYAAVAAYWDDGVQILDVTDPPAITAAGSITDDAALELLGASGIATFTSGGRTYAAVAAYEDDGVQILRLTGDGAPRATLSIQFVTEMVGAQGVVTASIGRSGLSPEALAEDRPSLDFSHALVSNGTANSAYLSDSAANHTATVEGVRITVSLPAGATVTGDSWDGLLGLPAPSGAAPPAPGHLTVHTKRVAFLVGADTTLHVDRAVRILVPGEGGQNVFFSGPEGAPRAVPECAFGDSQEEADAGLGAGGDCHIDVGMDLAIWTRHLSDWGTYHAGPRVIEQEPEPESGAPTDDVETAAGGGDGRAGHGPALGGHKDELGRRAARRPGGRRAARNPILHVGHCRRRRVRRGGGEPRVRGRSGDNEDSQHGAVHRNRRFRQVRAAAAGRAGTRAEGDVQRRARPGPPRRERAPLPLPRNLRGPCGEGLEPGPALTSSLSS